jgi:hypothetical protein
MVVLLALSEPSSDDSALSDFPLNDALIAFSFNGSTLLWKEKFPAR